ncbi:MAG: DUF4830 domain-containing protein [Oscillospiraceae bacterium]
MVNFIKNHKFSLLVIVSATILVVTIFILFSVDEKVNIMNIEYINSFGWQVEQNPTEISHLTIPDEFDVIYETYNALEKNLGFDLTKYHGIKVIRYSYKVTNHKDSGNGLIRANVFVHNDKIIAADICSLELGGFMSPIDDVLGKE